MSVIVKKTKLKFHFHNPNSVADTADYILKVFIKANEEKVEKALKNIVHNVEIANK